MSMQKAAESASDKISMEATEPPDKGVELLCIFARFEYALKETGFGRTGRNKEVSADWDSFAVSLGKNFFETICDNHVAKMIFVKPPSKQIIADNRLSWEVSVPPKNVQELLRDVRRVRNNLVHGGKHGDEDHDRNKELIVDGIAVLLEALKVNDELRDAFENRW